jgi:ribosome-associated heat shock protein Hsp15
MVRRSMRIADDTQDPGADVAASVEGERQRIDRWLWHARLVRTRAAAAALASSGYVRVNGARIRAAGRMVRTGDVITVALERAVRVLKVRGFADRRGPSGAGEALYEELG